MSLLLKNLISTAKCRYNKQEQKFSKKGVDKRSVFHHYYPGVLLYQLHFVKKGVSAFAVNSVGRSAFLPKNT